MVLGGGIFAYGISNVVDLFQQLYLDEAEHRHKMDLVNAFMHERSLPRKLRDEIRANFFHLRKATRENKVQDRAIVQLMSRTMQARVADLFCMDMMPHRLPSLAGCNAQFIHELYLVMDVKCYLPGEDIIRQDDYGSEMYFLFVGHVQVFIGHTKVAMFGPNSCFGEFAILNPRKARLATIQAMDFCETHCVEREELLKVLIRHPFMLHSIRQLVQVRSTKATTLIADSSMRVRTLIQGLAAVWHNEGLNGLLPAGVKVEDYPHLQDFASPMGARVASVRNGLAGGTTAMKRRSLTPAQLEYGVNSFALMNGMTSAAGPGASTASPTRRRPSEAIEDGSALSNTSAVSLQTTGFTRLRHIPSRGPESPTVLPADPFSFDGASIRGGNSAAQDTHVGTDANMGQPQMSMLLAQMGELIKRQAALELQLQEFTRVHEHGNGDNAGDGAVHSLVSQVGAAKSRIEFHSGMI
ncbi:hypothetical protein PINS_up001154 [Pythium insidiosum]|nr:hypothetical protein PINS_up001154 [Pythium insidiosum]